MGKRLDPIEAVTVGISALLLADASVHFLYRQPRPHRYVAPPTDHLQSQREEVSRLEKQNRQKPHWRPLMKQLEKV